ncbi:MAG: N-acetylneuraminate synthase family protein [Brevinematia bacterium]
MALIDKLFSPNRVFIVAEIGINHNGNPDKLIKLIESAKLSGADAVKFQIFSKDLFYIPENYLPKDISTKLPLDIFRKSFIPYDKYREAFNYSEELGILPFATPLDLESFEFLEQLNVQMYKVASSDINYVPLLRRIAETGKVVIISSGFSKINEIKKYIRLLKNNPLVVMFCVSRYPSLPEDISLREFELFRKEFEVTSRKRFAGFSDHTKTLSIPLAMASLGAKVIEKHLTLDENDDSYDNAVSISPEKFKMMVEMLREVEKSLSQRRRNLPPKFVKTMSMRSFVVRGGIAKGESITEENIEALRPSTFVKSSLENWRKILNKKSKKNFLDKEPLLFRFLSK